MTVNNIATPEGQVSRSCEEGPMAGDSLVFFDETTDIEEASDEEAFSK